MDSLGQNMQTRAHQTPALYLKT